MTKISSPYDSDWWPLRELHPGTKSGITFFGQPSGFSSIETFLFNDLAGKFKKILFKLPEGCKKLTIALIEILVLLLDFPVATGDQVFYHHVGPGLAVDNLLPQGMQIYFELKEPLAEILGYGHTDQSRV